MAPQQPMLAREYDPDAPPAFLPALVQPKLDGVRMLARLDAKGALHLTTRSGKSLDHLRPALEGAVAAVLKEAPRRSIVLDGELYAHGAGFQAIVSAVRNVGRAALTAAEGRPLQVAPGKPLKYHVYDLIDPERPATGFSDRHALLGDMVGTVAAGLVTLVPAMPARTGKDVDALHDRFVSQGYEGAMVRDAASPYEPGRRAPGLLKFKRFQDAEFRVVGWVEASGKDKGTVVFECEVSPGGARFRVRPQGTHEERSRMLLDAPALLGRMLTVRFQGRTLDGIPRFPIGIAIRDYE